MGMRIMPDAQLSRDTAADNTNAIHVTTGSFSTVIDGPDVADLSTDELLAVAAAAVRASDEFLTGRGYSPVTSARVSSGGRLIPLPAAALDDWPRCRLCDEQPAGPDGDLCGFCRADLDEDRINDPDAVDALRPELTHASRDDAGNANIPLLLVASVAAVIAWLPVLPEVWQAVAALSGIVTGGAFLRRTHGICRACGHPGSWRDPLTMTGQHRVHTRHVPIIKASREASRNGGVR